jgi:hypothetical protein
MKRLLAALLLVTLVLAIPAPSGDAAPAGDRARLRAMLNRLDSTLINIDFKDMGLDEAVKHISRWTGVNLLISPKLRNEIDPADLTITLTLSKITAREALRIILEFKNLGIVWRHGVLMITTRKDARGKPILRIYDIASLTFPIRDFPGPDLQLKPSGTVFDEEEELTERDDPFTDPQFIVDIIQSNVDPDSWDAEGVSIQATGKLLLVKTSATTHVKIARLLAMLRAYK